jgi:hypothetical protein
MIEQKYLQRQIKLNSQVIQGLSEELANLKKHRRMYYEDGQPEQAKLYSPYIIKFEKKLKKMVELQTALKRQLKQDGVYISSEIAKIVFDIYE